MTTAAFRRQRASLAAKYFAECAPFPAPSDAFWILIADNRSLCLMEGHSYRAVLGSLMRQQRPWPVRQYIRLSEY